VRHMILADNTGMGRVVTRAWCAPSQPMSQGYDVFTGINLTHKSAVRPMGLVGSSTG